MPTFDFTSPDGKTYSVEGPDGATPDQAFQMLQQHIGSAKPQASMGEDAAKSVASGLANATAGTLGLAGDLRTGLSALTDFAGGQLGASPDKVQAFKDYAAKAASMTGAGAVLSNAPTSKQVLGSATDPIVSPDYKPETTLGGYLKTGAEFAPGLLLGGRGSLPTRLLRDVAAPAVASETAGLATKDTAAEPYARAAGALLGSAGAGKLANMAAERGAMKASPPPTGF